MPLVPLGIAVGRGLEVGPNGREIILPVPMTTAWIVAGRPIDVPSDLPRDRRLEQTARLQQAMDEQTARAESYAAGAGPPVAPTTLKQLQALR